MKGKFAVIGGVSVCGILLSFSRVFAAWNLPSSLSFDESREAGVTVGNQWDFPPQVTAKVHSYETNDDREVEFTPVPSPATGFVSQWTADITTSSADHADISFLLDGETFSYSFSSVASKHTNAGNPKVFRAFIQATYHFTVSYDGASYTVDSQNDNPNNQSVLILHLNSSYPYLYLWKNGGNDKNAAWPGEKLTIPWHSNPTGDGKTLYYIQFEKGKYDRMILHNGQGNKTADIVLNSGQEFDILRYWLDSNMSFDTY